MVGEDREHRAILGPVYRVGLAVSIRPCHCLRPGLPSVDVLNIVIDITVSAVDQQRLRIARVGFGSEMYHGAAKLLLAESKW